MFQIGIRRADNIDMKKSNRKVLDSEKKWLTTLTGRLFLHFETVVTGGLRRGGPLPAPPQSYTIYGLVKKVHQR